MSARDQPPWSNTEAPSLDDIESLAQQAFARLPDKFRRLCADVVFRVEEFPSDEVIAELNAQSEFDLLGLFQGVGMPQRGGGQFSGQLPNFIFLYRRPILDYWAEHRETLGAIVTHVLVHEIGHHFGFSDDDMLAIEKSSRR